MQPEITVKKRCCDDRPRCRSCPYVWERLASCGWAVSTGRRTFHVCEEIPGKVMKLARKRKARPLPQPH